MQAIILAGGLGTRLRAAVPDLPKPMAPVAGRPFLAYVLDGLVEAGFERAVLAVGYRHEIVREHFGDRYRGLPLSYSIEPTPLGTGGAIRLAAQQIDTDPFFVINGDTYVELDYRAMVAAHQDAHARITIGVCAVPDVARYGALELRGNTVCRFREKGSAGPGVINAGAYLLTAELLEHIPLGQPFSFEQQLLAPRVEELRPLAFHAQGLFIDIGVPQDYKRAQYLLKRGTDTPAP